ncbi:hypothetical protein [Photobacterium rosenbergii]|uniref:hypothetical protein n=1 Tax=Photobacterium rosenbergii TaxID=294936 RepID=UPI001C99483B|nr:hypothetical protein [Photobacterium rosenbergii]MBY5948786.1 hypothetical protein [Photobacterium rosenbergii]
MSKRVAHNRNLYPYHGEMLGITELSQRGAKNNPRTIKSRINQLGWSIEDAVDKPYQDTSITNSKHGMRNSREYSCWRSMKERILNEDNASYKHYGAKGLTIEPDWLEDFELFMVDIGEMPEPKERYSIDRIDNTKGYLRGNVRWATLEEQARNKSNNIYEVYRGEQRLVVELAEEAGMEYRTLYSRLYNRGWDIEKAMMTPLQEKERLFQYKGEMINLVEIAEAEGKKYQTLYYRVIRKNMTIEQALAEDPFPKLPINGEMLSKNQICEKYPISLVTLTKRLSEGMTPEQAVADQTERKLYDGKLLSRKELAVETGLSIDTIRRRWRKGLPIEEIVKPQARKMTKHLHKGAMRSLSEISKMESVSNGSLARHIRNGMSLEEALAYMGVSE